MFPYILPKRYLLSVHVVQEDHYHSLGHGVKGPTNILCHAMGGGFRHKRISSLHSSSRGLVIENLIMYTRNVIKPFRFPFHMDMSRLGQRRLTSGTIQKARSLVVAP